MKKKNIPYMMDTIFTCSISLSDLLLFGVVFLSHKGDEKWYSVLDISMLKLVCERAGECKNVKVCIGFPGLSVDIFYYCKYLICKISCPYLWQYLFNWHKLSVLIDRMIFVFNTNFCIYCIIEDNSRLSWRYSR